MSVGATKLEDRPELAPCHAVALRVVSARGLAVQYGGICQIDLNKIKLEEAVSALGSADFPWGEPKFGPMTSALTIGLELQQATLIFVLDPTLDAEFSESLPAVFAGNAQAKVAMANVRTWPGADAKAGVNIASVDVDMGALREEGDVEFNLALDNVGVTPCGCHTYRTPIIIDPEIPYPPAGGGVGGGAPPWP